MADLATEIRVFLSSTFVDLREVRAQLSYRLLQIFGAQLITMESFGSDAAPPEISSIRRVRECDIFVGIYARRYGTIDPKTGKSITELELDEAERAVSAGNVTAILVYLLDDTVTWPSHYADSEATAVAKLAHLKERARQHTITPFYDQEDLAFSVIKDVLSKIRNRMGAALPHPRHFSLPEERKLNAPIGMEFLSSADRRHLYGREQKIEELLKALIANPINLFLGNSGSGKTSLIHAGLIPLVATKGWLPIYTRPLGLPRGDISAQVYTSVFEGPSSYRGSAVPLLQEAANVVQPRKPILIIDQFEDVLTPREQEETERLIADLRTLRYLNQSNIRVLVSYRADLEARLGQFWQLISGSPEGLPRVYIAGISAEDAWKSIKSTCSDLKINLCLSNADELQIGTDLFSLSKMHGEEGVYPPYIQMFIDHAWRTVQTGATSYRFEDYRKAGRVEGVTGGYLTRLLTYANDKEGHIRSILASLVRSYGVKAQKSLSEIAADAGLTETNCEAFLERLIDLRLVRHLGNQYEIAHDFLAHEISTKLVDSEEREFKRFRELLTNKAGAFSTTKALLTVGEMLVLFKHKERVLPSDIELKLILASWAQEEGPGLFWLLAAHPAKVLELIHGLESENDLDDKEKATLVLLRRKISNAPLRFKDWAPFTRYKLAIQFVGLLSTHALDCPDSVLSRALRSKNKNVRAAVLEAIARKITKGNRKWISELGKSASPTRRSAFETLSLRPDIKLTSKSQSEKVHRPLREFMLLQTVASARSDAEARSSLKILNQFRPPARSRLFAKALVTFRTKGVQPIIRKLAELGAQNFVLILSPIIGPSTRSDFAALLRAYKRWNEKEAIDMELRDRVKHAPSEDKASALSETILRTATRKNLDQLRQTLSKITLTPSAQFFVLALLRIGNAKDVSQVIRKVERSSTSVHYWFQIEVARSVEKRMGELKGKAPRRLLRILAKKAFWENPLAEESKFSRKDLLSLKNAYNRTLYIRLIAHTAIGAARLEDGDMLRKLAMHDYHLIAQAAAIRLIDLAGEEGIRMLQSGVTEAVEAGQTESLALALRDAEIHKFELACLW
jgi:conflict system STAND superfamily ATPase/uncharacterized protein DUF4062